MSNLPFITAPQFDLKIPSTKAICAYRPFLVKEEKLLMMAAQEDKKGKVDIKNINKAVKQIIRNCTFDKLDPDQLATFDIEYIFLKIRSKSMGEILTPTIKCPKCGNEIKLDIDISDLEPTIDENHTTTINLTPTVGVTMRYPTLASSESFDLENEQNVFGIIEYCIDSIFSDKIVCTRKDLKPKDITDFIENLTAKQLEKVAEFFKTMPRIEKTIELNCPKCGEKSTIVLRGLQDFFGSPSQKTV